ncbi:DNA polymerase II large subunit [Halobacteriales archaeon QS_3_64_16]|nr:MAG: DNA polymerase II large subunit [Halobacteriales archaeon QS_3_64_16]
MSPADERYFGDIEKQLDQALAIAEQAKENGGDPSPDVEIPVAKDMADRVENLLEIEGVAARVRELEGEMGREEAALALARDFAEGRVGDYETRAGKVEGAVRTAVALLTEGVVAAPIEGIDGVEFVEDGNREFVRVYYAGPIRSAGGTAQALSVLVADYTRTLLGLNGYEPRTQEVERYAEEVELYDSTTGLQYSPKKKETRFIARHCPVMLDGEATGDEEVSGYRDLERVATNKPRGGMCLVLAEGIAQKAPKIKRYTSQLDELDWPWLDDLIAGTIGEESGEKENDAETPEATEGEENSEDPDDRADEDTTEANDTDGDDGNDDRGELRTAPRPEPSEKYLRDLIAGRPVFGHPSEPGGFRLRYGRARNHGFATAGVHPATMHLVDDFLATGTQIKTERPGKAAGVVPVDSIDGPTVKLANGDVRRIDDPEEALEVRNGVEAILDLGEYLVNYGEFLENNHPLAPASYTVEWWLQDFAAAGGDAQAIEDSARIDVTDPGAQRAIEWAREYDAPLHPAYTYLWHDLSVESFETLREAVGAGELSDRLYVADTSEVRGALETLLVPHTQGVEREVEDGERIGKWIGIPDGPALALRASLGFGVGTDGNADGEADNSDGEEGSIATDVLAADGGGLSAAARGHDDAMGAVAETAPFAIQERAPTRIGNRMGRPEKSEKRELSPAVHTLFPIGEAGGNQRDVTKATDHSAERGAKPGEIGVQLGRRECTQCGTETFRTRCPEDDCGGWTEPAYECPDCEITVTPHESGTVECPRCGEEASSTAWRTVDLKSEYRNALESVDERENAFPILKGVKGLTSTHKTPEPIEKGVLRAKHGVSTFKDGTVRYDMTDLPVTSVRPAELDVSVDRFRQLGYEEDVLGDPLRHDDQLVELEVQDVVLSDGAADHLLKTAAFVDDLLVNHYDAEPFYELDDREELVGELVFGMAPHTSAAVVGRVVGFTNAAVGYAHPYFHAAKRRNCFHPETKLWYETEAGWQYGTIEELVETHLEDPTEDDFGTLVEEPTEAIRVPSLDADGEPTRETVEAVSKHPAPEHLVEIETADGHCLTVTPDHTMLRRASGEGSGIEEVRASEIAVGDRVPAYDGGETTTMTRAVGAKNGEATVADGGDGDQNEDGGRNNPPLSEVTRVEIVESESEHVYCLTVPTHRVAVNGIYAAQCDGDEDCVMLLMDGLLNFSKSFLPDKRGGKMDAPLVMSSRIDPAEIDDEAHNMDVAEAYPRGFYEATRAMADPGEVEITVAEESVGTPSQYTGFRHTHDTSNIALGPDLSAYKTLGSMLNKTNAQLELARKARAVDETDVAERIIEYHFLPDLIGNLRAFSRQETRCLGCGTKYRRVPLSGSCRECDGRVNLTVHEGSVKKYIETATTVAEEYDCRPYTKQRLEILERNIESIFEDDTNKQSGIADFM